MSLGRSSMLIGAALAAAMGKIEAVKLPDEKREPQWGRSRRRGHRSSGANRQAIRERIYGPQGTECGPPISPPIKRRYEPQRNEPCPCGSGIKTKKCGPHRDVCWIGPAIKRDLAYESMQLFYTATLEHFATLPPYAEHSITDPLTYDEDGRLRRMTEAEMDNLSTRIDGKHASD